MSPNPFPNLGVQGLLSRISRIRPGTWVAIGLGILALLVLLVWLLVASAGWLIGLARDGLGAAPEMARTAAEQVERVVPGAGQVVDQVVDQVRSVVGPAEAPRDVSGTDPGPVARYPGLARTHWQRDGREITVRYEGAGDYAAVLDHYAKGFAALGYAQHLQSAAPDEERHEYLKENDRVRFALSRLPKGSVKVSIVTVLP